MLIGLAVGAPPAAAGAEGPLTARARLDPALAAAATRPESVTVWVSFADRGDPDPAALAAALAAARASLSPRNLARRVRAGVTPLVDERDLPLHAPHLEALAARGLRPFAHSRWLNRVAVRLPGLRLEEIASLPFVGRVDAVARMTREPDPVPASGARLAPPERAETAAAAVYGQAFWQLAQLNVPAVHDSGYDGRGVLVCILDEGFNAHDTHEALRDQVIAPGFQRDFVEGDWNVTNPANTTDFNHGTWVMGCIGANRPGAYLGSAFGASFALGRTEVHASETQVEMLYWGTGAEWADSLGADLISSSLGYFTFDSPPSYTYADMDGRTTDISRSAQIAASKGILVVNAAGNQGASPWRYVIAPADVHGDSLIAVGATDAQGRAASFTSYGPSADGRVKPDLAAFGVLNPLVSPFGGPQSYSTGSGTSFATPLVAGLAACLIQARPAWRPTDVIRALRETASQSGRPDDRLGYGIPNGARALCWSPPGSGAPSLPRSIPGVELLGPNPIRAGGPPAQVRFAAGGLVAGVNPARVRVFDVGGRTVRTLWSGSLARGQCLTLSWDGRDDDRRVPHSGVYFISLEVAGETTTARLILLR